MRFIRQHLFVYVTVAAAFCVAAVFCANLYTAAVSLREAADLPVTVVLDAGHGGEDGGAVSKDGVRESRLNLEITLRLNDLLHLIGRETRLIRSGDVSVYDSGAATVAEKKVSDLKNRVRMVNEVPGALLVSIHQNMFEQSKYHGTQIFYAPDAESRALAEALQALTAETLDPSNHRAAKPADTVYLMNNIHCPGILIECGFLSNPEECARLCTEDYQKQLSLVIAGGLTDYLRKADTHEV